MLKVDDGGEWSGSWHLLGKNRITSEWEGSWSHASMRLDGWRKTYKNCLALHISTRCIIFSVAHSIRTLGRDAWLGAILGWVTFWEVSRKACEWGQKTLKRFVLVCGVNRQSWKQSGMLQDCIILVINYQTFIPLKKCLIYN